MKFNLHFSLAAFTLLILFVLIALVPCIFNQLLMEGSLHIIEDGQAIFLLACAVFTWLYMSPTNLKESKKMFWIWAVLWWVMFFGRSISWGRDYFPEIPHLYFRIVSILMIAPVVFMLFLKKLRQEIVYKLKYVPFPFWYLLFAVISLLLADSIEHQRFVHTLLLHDGQYQDLMEELYEVPFLLALFCTAFYFMRKDKQVVVKQ